MSVGVAAVARMKPSPSTTRLARSGGPFGAKEPAKLASPPSVRPVDDLPHSAEARRQGADEDAADRRDQAEDREDEPVLEQAEMQFALDRRELPRDLADLQRGGHADEADETDP